MKVSEVGQRRVASDQLVNVVPGVPMRHCSGDTFEIPRQGRKQGFSQALTGEYGQQMLICDPKAFDTSPYNGEDRFPRCWHREEGHPDVMDHVAHCSA